MRLESRRVPGKACGAPLEPKNRSHRLGSVLADLGNPRSASGERR